jgi:gamma-glutamyltranspeptidase/glutathione hydrolase
LLTPAIETAETGFAVSPTVAQSWGLAERTFAVLDSPEFGPWFDAFTKQGRAPRAGDVWASPDQASTLRRFATSNVDDFYSGRIAEHIAAFSAETGGHVTLEDLGAHTSTWVDPIGVRYRGYDIWEIPPNGQGIAALMALNLLEGYDLARLGRDSIEAHHLQIEAMKLAFADAHHYVADPEHADVPTEGLLSKRYADQRRELIGDLARAHAPGDPARGGTVYLCAADGDGMMVSYIQSNYQGFGSGIVIPGTGIAIQNRGAGFRLDPSHLNGLVPRKRPYHTIIPAFLTREGRAVGPFGVMGGHMQPQGHVQVVLNTVDWKMNPQAALDAPRWHVTTGLSVLVEQGVPVHVVKGLIDRGHAVSIEPDTGMFGKGQAIWRLESGAMVAGTEPRCDGLAVCW